MRAETAGLIDLSTLETLQIFINSISKEISQVCRVIIHFLLCLPACVLGCILFLSFEPRTRSPGRLFISKHLGSLTFIRISVFWCFVSEFTPNSVVSSCAFLRQIWEAELATNKANFGSWTASGPSSHHVLSSVGGLWTKFDSPTCFVLVIAKGRNLGRVCFLGISEGICGLGPIKRYHSIHHTLYM
jgi:hypothetical protein